MTLRQRYIEALTFGTPDRVPFQPGWPRESTLAAWRDQGLPPDRHFHTVLLETLGIQPEKTKPHVALDVRFDMIPHFEEQVLDHRDGHYLVQDWMGATVEISDRYDYTYLRTAKDFVTRKWHRFPVRTRADWERMKQRYDPRAPGRFPDDFEERCQALRDRDYVVGITFNGPFWQLREWCGFEGLCLLMADDPAFVDEMVSFWTDFVADTLSPILSRAQLDYVMISEDMAFKEHSMISPPMVRRFLLPAYERWVPAVKASGCPIASMDCDGCVADLIPFWIEAGFNSTFPVEVAAGNDIIAYRRRFGTQMAYQGGIDKRALARGGENMRAEVLRVVPPLLEEGGFIPSCDHGVPPDISWPDFLDYSRLLAHLTGWL
jgi:hypothetical protein